MNLYDFSAKRIDGEEASLADYRGKVVLIVNTATGCGFTPQYEGLEALYKKYAERGFVILDFPCNQFLHQAPGSDADIVQFCKLRYDVSFPQFSKIEVNGKNALPLYRWLKSQKKGVFGGNIKWNFTKFLLDREGNVVARFAPTKKPEKLEEMIQNLL